MGSAAAAATAAAEDDVLRRFVTLAPNVWTPESRADNPPQFRGEDIVDNVNPDTYLRASKASKVAVKYADRICAQRRKHTSMNEHAEKQQGAGQRPCRRVAQ